MLAVVAEVLRKKLGGLTWIERVGGLVKVASRPIYRQSPDMSSSIVGREYYPVANFVNLEDCWENGVYKLLEPDSTKSAVAFFIDNGGCQQIAVEGPKNSNLRFRFNLKLLCWLNLGRLGSAITDDNAEITSRIFMYFTQRLFGRHSTEGVFDGNIEEQIFHSIDVKTVDELIKTPSMFSPFTFSEKTELFFWPYDYLGIRLTGEFVVSRSCLPEFGENWTPSEGCFFFDNDPGGDGAWLTFCDRMYQCLSNLEEFDTPEAGQAGGKLINGYRFFVMGQGTDSVPYGTIMRLPDA